MGETCFAMPAAPEEAMPVNRLLCSAVYWSALAMHSPGAAGGPGSFPLARAGRE